jgi:hypothetical protein
MTQAYWVNVFRSVSDAEKLVALRDSCTPG